MVAEFRSFLLKTNALALAIGVIIGAALGSVVNSLVNDIIMPPVGQLLGRVDFSQLRLVLGTTTAADGTVTEVAIRWGAFINTVIAFIIVAFVVWRLSALFIKPEPEPAPIPLKACPFCREQVDERATKCRYCGSEI